MPFVPHPPKPSIKVRSKDFLNTFTNDGHFTPGHHFIVQGEVSETGDTALIDDETTGYKRLVFASRNQFDIIED